MAYDDKKLAEKVSRADLTTRIRSQALRSFCMKSVPKEWKNLEEKQKLEKFLQSAGSESRVLSKIAKSPEFGDLSKNSFFASQDKPKSALSISCIDSSYEHWPQFADEHTKTGY